MNKMLSLKTEKTNELINRSIVVEEINRMLNYMDAVDVNRIESNNTDDHSILIRFGEEQIILPNEKDIFSAIYEALFSIKAWYRD